MISTYSEGLFAINLQPIHVPKNQFIERFQRLRRQSTHGLVHHFVELRVHAGHRHPPVADYLRDGDSPHRLYCQHPLYQLLTFYRNISRHLADMKPFGMNKHSCGSGPKANRHQLQRIRNVSPIWVYPSSGAALAENRAADRVQALSTRLPLPEWPGPVLPIPRFSTRVRPDGSSTFAFVINVDARRPSDTPFHCQWPRFPRGCGTDMEQLASFRRQLKTELFVRSFPDLDSSVYDRIWQLLYSIFRIAIAFCRCS